jgi:hypothetical protein
MVEWKLPESTMVDGRAVRYGVIGLSVHGPGLMARLLFTGKLLRQTQVSQMKSNLCMATYPSLS